MSGLETLRSEASIAASVTIDMIRLCDIIPIAVDGEELRMHFSAGKTVVFPAEGDSYEETVDPDAEVSETTVGSLVFNFPDGFKRAFVISGVDHESLESTVIESTAADIATAYILGRLDQIKDMEGSNEKRFVRARDLGQAIDLSAQSVIGSDMTVAREEYLVIFDAYRGVIKSNATEGTDSVEATE